MIPNFSYCTEIAQFGLNHERFSNAKYDLEILTYDLQQINQGTLFYATSSSMHRFIAIVEFKLKVTVRNCTIWVKIIDLFSRQTFQFDVWPWKTIAHLLQGYFKLRGSFRSHQVIPYLSSSTETANLGQIRWFLEPRDLEIWRITCKNNRAPLLCYFKLSCSIL